MSIRNRVLVGFLGIAGVAVAIFAGIAVSRRSRAVVQTAPVEALAVLEARVTATGEVRPKNYVELQAEIAGVVTYLPVREGEAVRQGQVLLRIDPSQAEADLRAQEAHLGNQTHEAAAIQGQIAIGEANGRRDQASLEAARAEQQQAESDLQRARARFARRQQLHEENLLAQEDYEAARNELAGYEARAVSARAAVRRAESQLEVARVALDQARAQHRATLSRVAQAEAVLHKTRDLLSKTVIRSPLTGVITRMNVEVGERAVPGTLNNPAATLMEIADLSVIEVEVRVDEADIVHVRPGQPADVVVDAMPDVPLEGRVTEIGSSALAVAPSQQGQQARDFKVVVQLRRPPADLRPGLSATAEITTATRHGVLTIPLQALTVRSVEVDAQGRPAAAGSGAGQAVVRADSGRPAVRKKELQGVFVVSPDGRARFRPVETGIHSDTAVEVTGGLSRGEVIVTGSYRVLRALNDGDAVRVDNSGRAFEEG